MSSVFTAMLRAPRWEGTGQHAFRFFLEKHIRFDLDIDKGHGALSRRLKLDDDILSLWTEFEYLLMVAAPVLVEIPCEFDIGDTRGKSPLVAALFF